MVESRRREQNMNKSESEMTVRASELRELGATGPIQVWCHLVEFDNVVRFFWTVFMEQDGQTCQISGDSWPEIIKKVRALLSTDHATREQLLAL